MRQFNWLFLFTWAGMLVFGALFWAAIIGWVVDLLVGA
jgi:hypothetical protein